MRISRTGVGAGLLVVEAGLAVLGALVHYGFTAEYGDISDSALEGWMAGFSAGLGGPAVALTGSAAVVALVVSTRRWMRLTAAALPLLMVAAMFVVTPAALQRKLEIQYDASPQCVSREDMGPGPGTRAARESQEAFESIEHVGHFSGGAGSGGVVWAGSAGTAGGAQCDPRFSSSAFPVSRPAPGHARTRRATRGRDRR